MQSTWREVWWGDLVESHLLQELPLESCSEQYPSLNDAVCVCVCVCVVSVCVCVCV